MVDTYLSPSSATAVRYAVNKRFGSELLSYTLDFLDELVRRKVPGIVDGLYQRYPHIYDLLTQYFLRSLCAGLNRRGVVNGRVIR